MKKIITLLLLAVFSDLCLGQARHDYVWLTGYGSINDSTLHFGGTRTDFSHNPPALSYFTFPDSFSLFNPCSMADSAGNLVFYTNGCKIVNAQHEVMENGYDINPGPMHDYLCKQFVFDYDGLQGSLALPWPGRPNYYILFHATKEWGQGGQYGLIRYCYSEIDMMANNGLGKVVEKNRVILGPDNLVESATATRHANGRDWWIMMGNRHTNVFYTFLLTPQGIGEPIVQDLSASWISGQNAARSAVFSPDGRYFARISLSDPAAFTLFHFDRCSARLYDPIRIDVPDIKTGLASWLAFSPNSRYLYLTNRGLNLFQFNVAANDISASARLIGEWDGFKDPESMLETTFHCMSLAPNGKIYMAHANGTRYLHTIHNPDAGGAACDFRQHDVVLPTFNQAFVPTYPNYRLLDLPGSPCDTLGIDDPAYRPPTVRLTLSPNPTQRELRVQWPDGTAPMRLRVFDVLGRRLFEQAYTADEVEARIAVESWAAATYFLQLDGPGKAAGTYKFVVVR